ncbi:MAG: prefoldin subunit alpha [Candidatus Pacearchaeota archaeon]|nr:prefoldin subunit alpha [Candidatus Pacearchaeota archaeon]
MEEQENQQELLFKFSMYERQIRELQQQIEAISRGIVELDSLNLGLDELVGAEGKEIYAPMGKGIFVKAKLISEELNVDIGNGNIVKKSIPATKELIGEQITKLGQVKKELENNLEQLGNEITEMMNDAQAHEHAHHHCGCEEDGECNCGHNHEECECKEED